MCVTTSVSVPCPLTGAAGAVVPLPATGLSGIGPFRLYHRYVVGYALDPSPFATTFNVTAVPTSTFTSTGCSVITGASTSLTLAGCDDTDPFPRADTTTV